MGQQVNLISELKLLNLNKLGTVKTNRNNGVELIELDPKPSDLSMIKLKSMFFYWRTELVYVA